MMYEQSSQENQTARLEDYLQAIRGHRLLIVMSLVAMLLVGWWFDGTRTPIFESSTAVALGPTPVGASNSNGLVNPSVERESEILASKSVAEGVVERLELAITSESMLAGLEVKFVPNSQVLQATYSGGDPAEVSAIANGFVEEYTEQREAAATRVFDTEIEVLEEEVDAVNGEVEELQLQIENATSLRVAESTKPSSNSQVAALASIDGQLSVLRSDLGTAQGEQRTLNGLLSGARRSLRTKQATAEVIRLSEPASTPSGISSNVLILGFGLLGLIFGIATAFLIDRLDRTARDVKALNLALGSNVVGEIPSFGLFNRGGSAALIMLTTQGSARVQRTKESIRRLRSAVQFLVPTVGVNGSLVIALSSAYPGEGKSTTSCNLAIALAQGGNRVILISADLRRPTIETMFGIDRAPGLADLLGHREESLTLIESGVDGLWVVPSGSAASNPSELLGSSTFETAIKELRLQADFVIVDTPPVLATADALVVGPRVDGMMIVVDSRTTGTDDLLQVRAELERSGTRLLGSVLNRDKKQSGSLFRRNRYSYSKAGVS